MPVYVATKKVLYPVMVTQFNFSNLDSWPSRDPGPLLPLSWALSNRRASGSQRNCQHLQEAGFSIGAGEGGSAV